MALQKEKTLANGAVGNYWRISGMRFERATMKIDFIVDLYKDETAGLTPLGCSHQFSFILLQQEIVGNLIALAYNKIKAFAASDIPNIDGNGTHKGCADLDGAIDV